MPLLEYIKLSCKEDDGGRTQAQADDHDSLTATFAHQPFNCPALQHITMDGRNFYNACQRNIRWTEMLSNIRTLNVLHFKSRASYFESFTMSEFIASLDPLQFLHLLYISDLDLAPSSYPDTLKYPSFLPVIDIELKDLSNPISVFELIDTLRAPYTSISIMGCLVNELPIYEGALALMFVPMDHDLILILQSFQDTKLSLHGCPGFHDHVLGDMQQAVWAIWKFGVRVTQPVSRERVSVSTMTSCQRECMQSLARLKDLKRSLKLSTTCFAVVRNTKPRVTSFIRSLSTMPVTSLFEC